jgi:hypothetical protein
MMTETNMVLGGAVVVQSTALLKLFHLRGCARGCR